MFSQNAPVIVSALDRRVSGAEFGDYISGLLGDATHALIANHGEDVIVGAMMQVPQLALFGAARLREFAHGFFFFDAILEEQQRAEAASA
jgi:hypothetical protein